MAPYPRLGGQDVVCTANCLNHIIRGRILDGQGTEVQLRPLSFNLVGPGQRYPSVSNSYFPFGWGTDLYLRPLSIFSNAFSYFLFG